MLFTIGLLLLISLLVLLEREDKRGREKVELSWY